MRKSLPLFLALAAGLALAAPASAFTGHCGHVGGYAGAGYVNAGYQQAFVPTVALAIPSYAPAFLPTYVAPVTVAAPVAVAAPAVVASPVYAAPAIVAVPVVAATPVYASFAVASPFYAGNSVYAGYGSSVRGVVRHRR